jgi:hypothetical protein
MKKVKKGEKESVEFEEKEGEVFLKEKGFIDEEEEKIRQKVVKEYRRKEKEKRQKKRGKARKRIVKHFDYSKIPPYVIFFHIFAFYNKCYNIPLSYGHDGKMKILYEPKHITFFRFKNDPNLKIWFAGKSFSIRKNVLPRLTYTSLKKIVFPDITSLQDIVNGLSIFGKELKFTTEKKRGKEIGYLPYEYREKINSEKLKKKSLSKIEKLSFFNFSYIFNDWNNFLGLNIDKIFSTFQFESLKTLEFKSCAGLKGYFGDVRKDSLKSWRKMLNLEILTIKNCAVFKDEFFINRDFSSLRVIKILFHSYGENYTLTGQRWSMMFNLEELKIKNCYNFGDDLFINGSLNKLKKITLDNLRHITGKNWSKMPKLEKLDIWWCYFFTDDFFRSRDFGRLKILLLDDLPRITGKTWSKMPKLEKLEIHKCEKFEDSFFRTRKFNRLTVLDLNELPLITGKNWSKMFNLERISFGFCELFIDDFFKSRNFNKLKSLKIVNMVSLTGTGWSKMPNLEELEIEYFYQDFYMHGDFSKLKTLRLEKIPKLWKLSEGVKKWINMPKLEKLYVGLLKAFTYDYYHDYFTKALIYDYYHDYYP